MCLPSLVMRDIDLFRAAVRDIVEERDRARGAYRATWCLVALAAVTACGTLALVVLALLSFLAR